MTRHLLNLRAMCQPQPGPDGQLPPHQLADNDNDDPPALPVQAALALPLLVFESTADGLLT